MKRVRLHVNAQWSEPTSLRLLELITASAAESTPVRAAGCAPAAVSRPVEVLRQLARTDEAFRAWLEVRAGSASASPDVDVDAGTSADNNSGDSAYRIDAAWLEWLADAPTESSTAEALIADTKTGEVSDAGQSTQTRFAFAVRAAASLALRYRNATQQVHSSKAEVARGLAYDMAYGLSHELNNPLANIASRARLLAEAEPEESKRLLLAGIVDQAMRGCEMIADLMLVARPPVPKLEPTDLSLLIVQLSEQARPWLSARGLKLHVSDEFESPAPRSSTAQTGASTVMTDRDAAREALWALLRNAVEAARQQITMTLALRTPAVSADVLSECNQRGEPTLPFARSYVEVTIVDDGAGLSQSALEHAWNPYFSGREAGRGLGLGLSKADRLARLAGGYVRIESLSAGGCVVRIAWPHNRES